MLLAEENGSEVLSKMSSISLPRKYILTDTEDAVVANKKGVTQLMQEDGDAFFWS
jgi:hypothetical protein